MLPAVAFASCDTANRTDAPEFTPTLTQVSISPTSNSTSTRTVLPGTLVPILPTMTLAPQCDQITGRIAYSTAEGDLWVMNADGSGQIQLTDSKEELDYDPSWSPDGTRIVFRSDRAGYSALKVVHLDTLQITQIEPEGGGSFADWSPNGAWIAFTGQVSEGSYGIFVMRPDGAYVTNLNVPFSECAKWSPDGSKIAFCTHRDGNWEVYVMNADGSGQRRLTHSPRSDRPVAWSPEGEKLAIFSQQNGAIIINADGSNVHRPRFGIAAWLPDGRVVGGLDSNGDGEGDDLNSNGLPDWYIMTTKGSVICSLPHLEGLAHYSPFAWLL